MADKNAISESTVARIAGNLLSGVDIHAHNRESAVRNAVATARAIVAEVKRTEAD
jgi:hypothetical protein